MDFFLQIIINGLLLGGLYALLAVGLTLIFGVLRVVNFAHAEFMMLGMYGAFWLWRLFGFDPYLSALIVVPIIFLFGMLTGRLIIQRTIGAPDVMVVFATLGLSILLQNLALTFWTADIRSVSTAYSGAVFVLGGIRFGVGITISFAVALTFALGLSLFLNRTRFGKAIQAVAQNRNAAYLMGINVRRVYLITYSVAVAAAGAMGVLIAPVFSAFPRVGQSYIVTAFVIVVLAGLGSLHGAVIAALLIGVILTTAGYFIGTAWAELAYFVVFIAVLIVRPQGFFGKKGAEIY